MGTPEFAKVSLQKLLEAKEDVIAVFTQPDKPRGRGKKLSFSPVKELAIQHEIPVYQPTTLKGEAVFKQMEELRPDLIIVVAYGQILPKSILDLPAKGCINVHASLLPKYRGAAPIHWAIINGEKTTGVTTMFMAEQLDAGDMIIAEEVVIFPDTNVGQLHHELAVLGGQLLLKTMALIKSGCCPRIPQNEDEATYASMIHQHHELIHWDISAGKLVNIIRGMNPWPVAYTYRDGQRLKIYRARVAEIPTQKGEHGEILAITEEGFLVQTGNGVLEIMQVQPAGKKQISAADYVRGYKLEIGEILG